MSKVIFIVATQPQPEVEQKFNKWYNEIHIPMLLKFKGLKGVKRGKLMSAGSEAPAYLALYEFDNTADVAAFNKSAEMKAAVDEMKTSWKDGGVQTKWAVPYELLGEWHK